MKKPRLTSKQESTISKTVLCLNVLFCLCMIAITVVLINIGTR